MAQGWPIMLRLMDVMTITTDHLFLSSRPEGKLTKWETVGRGLKSKRLMKKRRLQKASGNLKNRLLKAICQCKPLKLIRFNDEMQSGAREYELVSLTGAKDKKM